MTHFVYMNTAKSTFEENVSKQSFYACAGPQKSDVAATFRILSPV